jgi:hypothetical protein
MKKMFKTILSLCMIGSAAMVSAQTWPWAVRSTGTSGELGEDVATDISGNNYVTGTYYGTAVFGSTSLATVGNGDVFLAKTNSSGVFQWAVRAASSGIDDGISVTTNGTDVFITGSYSGTMTFYSTTAATTSITSGAVKDCYVAKYNSSGVVQWAVTFGGAFNQAPWDIDISDAQQRIFVTGYSESSTTTGDTHIFNNCYNYSGTLQWSVLSTNTSTSAAQGYAVAADANGNSYVLSSYGNSTAISFPSTPVYSGTYGMLLAKFDLSGAVQWVQNIGNTTSGIEKPMNIGLDANANIYIGGDYTSTANISGNVLTNAGSGSAKDLFVAKYDNAGAVQWANRLGGTGTEYCRGLCTDALGNVFMLCQNNANNSVQVACQTFSCVFGNPDQKMFVVKYSSAGNVAWAAAPTIGNDGTEVHGISTNGDGYTVFTGELVASGTFGSTTLTATGGDAIVVKVTADDILPTISDQTICTGSGALLAPSAPTGSGITFNWYTSATGGTPFYTGTSYVTPVLTSTTTYYVSTLFTGGCESARVPVTVYVQPYATVTASPANQTICAGDCANISFTSVLGSVLLYSGASYLGSFATSPISVCPTTTTVYTLKSPIARGYCKSSTSVTVTVTPSTPISSDFGLSATNPLGSTTQYTVTATVASVPAGSGFWWEVSEIDLSTGLVVPGTTMTNPSNWWDPSLYYTNPFPGYCCNPVPITGIGVFYLNHKYRVTRGTWGPCTPWEATSKSVYMCTGCRMADVAQLIVEDDAYAPPMPVNLALGLNDQLGSEEAPLKWELYPNPASGIFNVRLETMTGADQVTVYDYTGKVIAEQTLQNADTRIDLSTYAKGIYFVKLKVPGRTETKKIIIE